MASIPDLGTRDPLNADRPAGSASNGVAPGQAGHLLRGQGMIGGAQEASDQPTKVAHPHGPYLNPDGTRYRIANK